VCVCVCVLHRIQDDWQVLEIFALVNNCCFKPSSKDNKYSKYTSSYNLNSIHVWFKYSYCIIFFKQGLESCFLINLHFSTICVVVHWKCTKECGNRFQMDSSGSEPTSSFVWLWSRLDTCVVLFVSISDNLSETIFTQFSGFLQMLRLILSCFRNCFNVKYI
jgi:hypothetical protein